MEHELPLPLEATDLALLRLLYQQYAVQMNQLPRFLDLLEPGASSSSTHRKSVAYNLVERLQRFGLLHLEILQHDQDAWIWLTKEGAKVLGVSISGNAPSYRILPTLSATNTIRLHLAKHEPDATWFSRVDLRRDTDEVGELPTAELRLPTGERIALFVMVRPRETKERITASLQSALQCKGQDEAPYYRAIWYYASKEMAPTLRSVRAQSTRNLTHERTPSAVAIFAYPPAHTRLYREHQAPVAAIAWSPDGKWLATGADLPGPECTVRLWDPLTGKDAVCLSPPATPTCISWSPQWLVVGDMQGGLSWWKPSGKQGQKPSGISHHHPNMIVALAWSVHHPDQFATCSAAGKLVLSDLRQNSVRWQVPVHGGTALAWSPDGAHLALGEVDGTIRFYSAHGKEEKMQIKHPRACFALAWSPDGRWFASSGQDHLLVIRESTSGQQKHFMRGRERFILALAWSPDGRFLASAGDEGRMQIWRTSTWTPLQTFWEHTEGITGLAWSPESTAIASASRDGTVLITPVAPEKDTDTQKTISLPLRTNAGMS